MGLRVQHLSLNMLAFPSIRQTPAQVLPQSHVPTSEEMQMAAPGKEPGCSACVRDLIGLCHYHVPHVRCVDTTGKKGKRRLQDKPPPGHTWSYELLAHMPTPGIRLSGCSWDVYLNAFGKNPERGYFQSHGCSRQQWTVQKRWNVVLHTTHKIQVETDHGFLCECRIWGKRMKML